MYEPLTALGILIVAGWNAWKEIRERRTTKKFGLLENPERCAEHANRLTKLETHVEVIREDVKEIKAKV